ncbi:MAG: hypothetical protein ACKERG_02330 [Candidatus Hodgkinia cicadicola]
MSGRPMGVRRKWSKQLCVGGEGRTVRVKDVWREEGRRMKGSG